MALQQEFLDLLACPQCHGALRLTGEELLCEVCQLLYAIEDGVPVMIPEEAASAGEVQQEREAEMATDQIILFKIVEGKNKGQGVKLPLGTCRAIGRSVEDLESTRVFEVGSVVGLDDSTKQLVLTYVTRQFQAGERGAIAPAEGDSETIGSFKRLPDFSLADGAVSRLHAMIFHDKSGVGILDLVSKNGTFVNGTEVESKFLKEGDVVTIGGTKIRIERQVS